ncbi:MAG: putative transporter [Frankiales bacterium]|nr:putative transporter [Frankiales bacterium]
MPTPLATPPRAPVVPRVRNARVAVAALFFTNGAVFADVVPRYPEIKQALGLSNAALGSAIAFFPLGALLAGLFAAPLITRFRSSRVASAGIPLLAVAILLLAGARNWATVAAVMFVGGALDSVIDVAQNAHGLRVQRLYGRSIVNSFHGVWSVGAVTGGLLGSLAAGLRIPLGLHLGVGAALFSLIAIGAYRFLLAGPENSERAADAQLEAVAPEPLRRSVRAVRGATVRVLGVLGILAALGAVVEDAGSSWGALYLRNELGTSAAVGGLAFVVMSTAMTVGRLTGDRFVDRFGQRTVVRVGGAVTAVGMGIALAAPTLATTLLGFGLSGLGVATLVPAAMHSADELRGLPDGVGLTVVSWLLRVGFLASPPLVGIVADATSLRVGLLGVVCAGLGAFMFGRVLVNRPAQEH